MKKTGRPSKLPTIDLDRVEQYAAAGMTEEEIASALGVHRDTLIEWKKRTDGEAAVFSDVLKRGKLIADERVIQSLYKRATGYEVEEVTREYYPPSDEDRQQGRSHGVMKSVKIVTKAVQPDTLACIYWLNNRRRQDWRKYNEVPLESPPDEDLTEDQYKAVEEVAMTIVRRRTLTGTKGNGTNGKSNGHTKQIGNGKR